MGRNLCRGFSLESAGSHSSSSLSEIIIPFPIKPLSLSFHQCIILFSILFLIPHFHTSSSKLPPLYNGSSITPFPVCSGSCCSHLSPSPAFQPLFSPLLYCYSFSSSSILPSFPLAARVGAMQVARAKDTCGTG